MRRTFLLLTVFICLTEAYTSWDGEGTAADYFGTKIGKVKEAGTKYYKEYVISCLYVPPCACCLFTIVSVVDNLITFIV